MNLFYQTVGRVQFRDTDAAGIVHYTSFFNWMEQAEHEFLRRLDWSVVRQEDGFHLSWPRAKVRCEFRLPLKFQQVFGLQIHIQSIGRSSVGFGFEFLHPGDLNKVWPDGIEEGIHQSTLNDAWRESIPSQSAGRKEDESFRLVDRGWISESSWFDEKIKPAATGNITSVCCKIVSGVPPKSTEIPELLKRRLESFLVTEQS